MYDNLERWALEQPDKPAVWLEDSLEPLRYLDLHRRSSQVAQWLLSLGLPSGSGIAMLMENGFEFFEVLWGARRAGLYLTPISPHLKPAEIAYVLQDCGAGVIVATAELVELAGQAAAAGGQAIPCYVAGRDASGAGSLEPQLARFDGASLPAPPPAVGREFLYSSGTSGRPKAREKCVATSGSSYGFCAPARRILRQAPR